MISLSPLESSKTVCPFNVKNSFQGLRSTFETNTIGPLLIAKYFSPLLLKGSGLIGQQSVKKHSGILVNVTAKVSSISGSKILSNMFC